MKHLESMANEANDNGRAPVIEFTSIARSANSTNLKQEPGQVIEFQSIARKELRDDPELPPAA
ncbi:hypothetical protein GF391_01975 [Candidatus Uhrbacteria bacterium]|nr:hypothetical protein [Candidatus Uhrbacteria bacterium]